MKRVYIDLRKIHKVTTSEVYLMPIIRDCLDCYSGCMFFTSLDAKSGYLKIELTKYDREKTVSLIIEQLSRLTRKDQPFHMGAVQLKAFATIKQALCETPILYTLNVKTL